MQEKTEQIRSQEQQDATPQSLPADSSPAETQPGANSSDAYAKYALVAAPPDALCIKGPRAPTREPNLGQQQQIC